MILSLNFPSLQGFSSSLLLFPQRFSQYVFWPSSGVCQTWEPTWNFELQVACSDSMNHNQVQVLSIPVLLLACCQD